MDREPRDELSLGQWMDQFKRAAEPGLRGELASEDDQGTLQELIITHRGDGAWVAATFSMASHPGITFIWDQRVIPDLSAEWEPDFAATLFSTHLIEWFHTKAKRRLPDVDGIIRNRPRNGMSPG